MKIDKTSLHVFTGTSEPIERDVYVISVATGPGSFSLLDETLSLEQVNERHWRLNRPLEMYFSLKVPKEEEENETKSP